MNKFLSTCTAVALLAASALPSSAGTVSLTNTINDIMLDSTGAALDDAFYFELGSFDTLGGFTPTSLNTDQWLSHWKPFSRGEEPTGTWNSGAGAFYSGATFMSPSGESDSGLLDSLGNTPTFAENETFYLWVYDDRSLLAPAEWALLTDTSWRFPDPASVDPGDGQFFLNTASETPIVGSFTQDFTGAPDHNSRLQTASIAAVPEPSSLFLLAIAGVLARFQRTGARRRA
jgi:PEP-CTERM motif